MSTLQRANTEPTRTVPLKKRTAIPQAIRIQVWEEYCGTVNYKGQCYACHCAIDPFRWECSHVISDSRGGEPTVVNLRPCCSPCNGSMKDMNMKAFCIKYGLPGISSFMTPEEVAEYKSRKRIIDDVDILRDIGQLTISEDDVVISVGISRAKCSFILQKDGRRCSKLAVIDNDRCHLHLSSSSASSTTSGTRLEEVSQKRGRKSTKVDYTTQFLDEVCSGKVILNYTDLATVDSIGIVILTRKLTKRYHTWLEDKHDDKGMSLISAMRTYKIGDKLLFVQEPRKMKWCRDGTKGHNECSVINGTPDIHYTTCNGTIAKLSHTIPNNFL